MTHITYANLPLTFTPPASGNGWTAAKINLVIENMYAEAESVGDTALVAACVFSDATTQINDYARKMPDNTQPLPNLHLSKESREALGLDSFFHIT
jgi:hypothetical protein